MEGLKFCNEELTHLDAHLISDHNLTSNYFIPEEPSLKLAKRLEEEGKVLPVHRMDQPSLQLRPSKDPPTRRAKMALRRSRAPQNA